ncbi:MAG: serine hydrolase [Bacteroidia bacterium]
MGLIISCNGQSTSKTPSVEQTQKTEKLEKLISTYAEYGEFNGAVLVAEEGKVIFQKGFGLANMEWDIPNQTDTKFRIGSITKQFTAMLIVQLAAEGKLDLHTPISKYLSDYPKENGDRITLHHLLTHTAGVPNNYDSSIPKVKKLDMIIPDNYAPKDLVGAFSSLPLDFSPGEKFSYSNSGYVVLGHLIEVITQKSYAEVLEEKIFAPLKMTNTGVEKHRPLTNNRASGYFQSWGMYYNANYIDMSRVFSAGAIYSTVEDLFIWDQALHTEQLLPQEYLDQIFSQHIPDPDYGGYYGYGWSLVERPLGNSEDKIEIIGHDGVIDGFCAIFTRIPSSKASVILLSNIRRAPLNAMTKGIMGILYDKPYDFPRKSAANSLFDVIDKEGLAKGIEHYEAIKDDAAYYLSENEMNMASYKFLQSDRVELAAEVLRLGIEAFPEAFNLYDSYGEVLIKLGKKKKAIANYKKSIELNPDNENGIRMLKELGVDTDKLGQ